VRDDAIGAAEVMYDPSLVTISTGQPDEIEAAMASVAHLTERFGCAPLIVRVDLARDGNGSPTLMELEAIEPNLYLRQAPASIERLADAIVAELDPSADPSGLAPRG